MSSKDEKQKRKALLAGVKQKQQQELLAAMPVSPAHIKELFDYLDQQLGNEECDDTLRLTQLFLKSRNLPVSDTSTWLATHGGYCDCEVLANVEEKFEKLL